MARTLTQTATVSTKKTKNPWQQPCFAIYTMEYGTYGGGYILFDHNINQIGFKMGDGNYAYNSYRTHSSYAPEFHNNYASSDYINTQSYPSSSSNYGNNTCWVGYLGHMFHHSVTPSSTEPGWIKVDDGGYYMTARGFRDVITLPSEKTQDYAIFLDHSSSNNRIRINSRSAGKYFHQQNWGWGNMNVSCKQNSGNAQSMYGCGSYNPKLKKLLIMENFDASQTFRVKPTVYDSVPDLRSYGNADSVHANKPESYQGASNDSGPLYNHFTNAAGNYDVDRYNEYNVNNRNGSAESSWRGQCVLCDNERIVLFRTTNGGNSGYVITRWNGPNEASQPGEHNGEWIYNTLGWTQYGYEQGERYGSRFQQSSDGRYVWLYSHAYYYGAGNYMCVVRVSDGKVIHWNYQDSGHGWMPFPVGKSDLGIIASYNTDSNNGAWYTVQNLDKIFAEQDDGSQYQFESGLQRYTLDACGNSTNYAVMVPAMYDTSLFSEPHITEVNEPNTIWPPSS
tara:strand:+ start:3118 stop:4638 length:1521 start_codon:yes stop_codon:yes gene_type:complete